MLGSYSKPQIQFFSLSLSHIQMAAHRWPHSTSLCSHCAQPKGAPGQRTAGCRWRWCQTARGKDSGKPVSTLKYPPATGISPERSRDGLLPWGTSELLLGCQIAEAVMVTAACETKPRRCLRLSSKLCSVLCNADLVVFASVDSWVLQNAPSWHEGVDTEENFSCFCV